ncbi:uncharacterized protein K444DRAFT_631548 [Hyaloscypha bicolor E]|uniref:Uncharacterized protein n=1 Tax=Hyaloscypha bicolor E TaxID=1095630 RepID=A0A2J6T476_9HELO|nr:uncharacterized protein K444DRAFT_631548 [Hyaloscypha bicolor E]PMD57812.1 hypothetical protein K444DRAFT_631548 [Hyaloscypha bicolor E]
MGYITVQWCGGAGDSISYQRNRASSQVSGFGTTSPLFSSNNLTPSSQAILSLPERITPIHETTGKKCTPAYFTISHPHPLCASVSREAWEAVPAIFRRLFLPEGGHGFINVNMEKDVILICSGNGKLRPKTFGRLKKAMGPKCRDDHLHLAAQAQSQRCLGNGVGEIILRSQNTELSLPSRRFSRKSVI